MRKLKFYAVYFNNGDKLKIVSVADNKRHAAADVFNHVCNEHKEHYESWCKIQNLDPSLTIAKMYYGSEVHEELLSQYAIKKIKILQHDLGILLKNELKDCELDINKEYPELITVTPVSNTDDSDTVCDTEE